MFVISDSVVLHANFRSAPPETILLMDMEMKQDETALEEVYVIFRRVYVAVLQAFLGHSVSISLH